MFQAKIQNLTLQLQEQYTAQDVDRIQSLASSLGVHCNRVNEKEKQVYIIPGLIYMLDYGY